MNKTDYRRLALLLTIIVVNIVWVTHILPIFAISWILETFALLGSSFIAAHIYVSMTNTTEILLYEFEHHKDSKSLL